MKGQETSRGRRAAFQVGTALLCFIGVAVADLSNDRPTPAEQAREAALLRAVNDYRAAAGRPRWRPDDGLAEIARDHSRRMARDDVLTHEGFRQRALLSGSASCIENLVEGANRPEQAIAMWRRSPSHHANLLDADAAWAGVGVSGRYATLLACASPAPAAAPVASGPDAGPASGPASGPRAAVR